MSKGDPFKIKTYSLYVTLTRRGKVEFSLEALRAALRDKLDSRPLCRYCNCLLTLENVSLDHLRPITLGGRSLLSNIQFICKNCNKSKSDFTDEEYRSLLKHLEWMEAHFGRVGSKKRVVDALRISLTFRKGVAWRAKEAQR